MPQLAALKPISIKSIDLLVLVMVRVSVYCEVGNELSRTI